MVYLMAGPVCVGAEGDAVKVDAFDCDSIELEVVPVLVADAELFVMLIVVEDENETEEVDEDAAADDEESALLIS